MVTGLAFLAGLVVGVVGTLAAIAFRVIRALGRRG